jgi:XTP/dITP diphosphohydrolase
MELVLATNNPNKLREVQSQLSLSFITVRSPHEVGVPDDFDVEETGSTFAENALLKAKAYSAFTKLPTVADDSGLVVHALDGEPGVHSKRWVPGSDHDRNVYLLEKLRDKSDRSAQFVTVLALYFPETDETHLFEGIVAGQIAPEERGQEGFGYDPVFIPDGYTHTFAEIGLEVKNTLSHRSRAVENLKRFFELNQEGSDVNISTTTGNH